MVIDLQGKRVFAIPQEFAGCHPVLAAAVFPGRPGDALLCPRHRSGEEDIIYLVSLASGKKTAVTLGSKPTYVEHGKAMVYERWPKERWVSGAAVKADLWRLELKPGAFPKMMIADAAEPAGQMP